MDRDLQHLRFSDVHSKLGWAQWGNDQEVSGEGASTTLALGTKEKKPQDFDFTPMVGLAGDSLTRTMNQFEPRKVFLLPRVHHR